MQPSISILNSLSSRVVKDLHNLNVESWEAQILELVNLYLIRYEAWWILNEFMFYCFIYLHMNLDLQTTNQLGEFSPNFNFVMMKLCWIVLERSELMVKLDPTTLMKRWTEVKTMGKVQDADWQLAAYNCTILFLNGSSYFHFNILLPYSCIGT